VNGFIQNIFLHFHGQQTGRYSVAKVKWSQSKTNNAVAVPLTCADKVFWVEKWVSICSAKLKRCQ